MVEQPLFKLSQSRRIASINYSELTLDGGGSQGRFDVKRLLPISGPEALLNDNTVAHETRPPDLPTTINTHGKIVDKTVDSVQ
jgi:hypothetical protein